MIEKKWETIFTLVKFTGLIALTGYYTVFDKFSFTYKAICLLIAALFIMFAIIIEWNQKIIILLFEGILAMMSVFLFPSIGAYYAVICVLDCITLMKWKAIGYFLSYLVLLIFQNNQIDLLFPACIISLLIVIYIQDKLMIIKYEQMMQKSEQTEGQLKIDMEKEKRIHNEALRKTRLASENEILEERNRITQAMHDKLGHNINGSLYQLEAAKLLIEKRPDECESIIQRVIDQLRISMDEIRSILRQEKPDRKRLAMLSLNSLFSECEEKYNINTKLNIEGDVERITDGIWEVILDNTFEAVTNALKYSECSTITMNITILNQVVRCNVSDDGKGAETIEEGMGIAGMKKRIRDIHGVLNIDTHTGFAINMLIPIEEKID